MREMERFSDVAMYKDWACCKTDTINIAFTNIGPARDRDVRRGTVPTAGGGGALAPSTSHSTRTGGFGVNDKRGRKPPRISDPSNLSRSGA